MMGHPSTDRAAYRAGSPYHRLESIAAPLLIVHGERDERVSPKQSEQLVARLRALGKTFEYVTYPTEAHGCCAPGRSCTSTGGWSASSTGTSLMHPMDEIVQCTMRTPRDRE